MGTKRVPRRSPSKHVKKVKPAITRHTKKAPSRKKR